MITGSGCTKRQPHHEELPGGTTATRRRIEDGRQANPMTTLYASATRRMGSATGLVTSNTTTLARNAQVLCTPVLAASRIGTCTKQARCEIGPPFDGIFAQ